MAEGSAKTAIAWTAVENIQNTVVQTSRALQDRYNIKVGEKVAITRIDGCLQNLASVTLVDISDAEKIEKYGEIPADERHYWEWALESNLSRCEVLASGLVFDLDLKGQRRSFNVVAAQPQNAGSTSHTIFRFIPKATKVSIGTDMGEAEEVKPSHQITVQPGGLGGLSKQIEDINESLSDFNEQRKLVMPSFYESNRGILIYGPKGTGKTTLLGQIEKAGWRQVFKIGSSTLGRSTSESESKLRNIFQEAMRSKPSVLIIDQLEFIAPKRTSLDSSSLAAVLCENLDAIRSASVLVVAATRHPNLVDDSLRTPHRLGTEIELQVPTAQDRAEILRVLRGPVTAGLSDSFLDLLAEKTHGYVGADLFALLQMICRKARQRQSLEQGLSLQNLEISPSPQGEDGAGVELDIQISDMMSALQEVRPTAMREVFLETPKVRWSDIGGQKEIKERLQNAVERPLKVRISEPLTPSRSSQI
jgi:AAA family ATPase